MTESIPARAEFAESNMELYGEQVIAASGGVLTLVHEEDVLPASLFKHKYFLELPEGEEVSSLDIVEHLERCGAKRAVVTFVNQAMEVRAPYLTELRKEEWDITALSNEEFDAFIEAIPTIQTETEELLKESGIIAHWQKNGRGDKVAYRLLLGQAAKRAIMDGDNGDWEAIAKKSPKLKSLRVRPRKQPEDDDFLGMYLQEIGRVPLLTKEGEVDLAQKIEAGKAAEARLESGRLTEQERQQLTEVTNLGNESWKVFVDANLRLVVSIAKRYQGTGAPLLDIIQMGNLGLMHAVDKFEWRKGFKFSTYATNWIQQSIQRELANTNREIRLPIHASDNLKKIKQSWHDLKLQYGRTPTVEELAKDAYLDKDKVSEVLLFVRDPLSLEDKIGEDQETERGDLIADKQAHVAIDESLTSNAAQETVQDMLALLDDRSRYILELRWGLDGGEMRTPDEVGKIVNLSRERVRQLEARAIAILRHPSVQGQFDIRSILS